VLADPQGERGGWPCRPPPSPTDAVSTSRHLLLCCDRNGSSWRSPAGRPSPFRNRNIVATRRAFATRLVESRGTHPKLFRSYAGRADYLVERLGPSGDRPFKSGRNPRACFASTAPRHRPLCCLPLRPTRVSRGHNYVGLVARPVTRRHGMTLRSRLIGLPSFLLRDVEQLRRSRPLRSSGRSCRQASAARRRLRPRSRRAGRRQLAASAWAAGQWVVADLGA
jgi:hypothetical protein